MLRLVAGLAAVSEIGSGARFSIGIPLLVAVRTRRLLTGTLSLQNAASSVTRKVC